MKHPKEETAGESAATVEEQTEDLAFDAPGFVEEMHRRVNLYDVCKKLLTANDPKIQQRTLEYLLDMRYGREAPVAVEETPVRVDVEFPKL